MDEHDEPPKMVPEPSPPESITALIRRRPRQLRFAEQGQKRAPGGYINLDKAIDELGRARFREQWDLFREIEEAPFQYEKKHKALFQYWLAPKSAEYALRKTKFVPRTLPERRAYRSADRIYKKVRNELIKAFETGAISTKMLLPNGQILDIPHAGTWAVQMRAIFYTGYLRHIVEGSVKRCRVLVDEKAFCCWGERGFAAAKTPTDLALGVKRAFIADFISVLPTLAARAEEQGYCFRHKWLLELMTEAARSGGHMLSKKAFHERIWIQNATAFPRQKPGRPSTDNLRRCENDKSELLSILRKSLKLA